MTQFIRKRAGITCIFVATDAFFPDVVEVIGIGAEKHELNYQWMTVLWQTVNAKRTKSSVARQLLFNVQYNHFYQASSPNW